jgi:hypothetical protein
MQCAPDMSQLLSCVLSENTLKMNLVGVLMWVKL